MSDNEVRRVKRYLDSGYTKVDVINLPDGEYKKYGGGHSINVHGDSGPTGYVILTTWGIKGMWGGNPITIASGTFSDIDPKDIIFYRESDPMEVEKFLEAEYLRIRGQARELKLKADAAQNNADDALDRWHQEQKKREVV